MSHAGPDASRARLAIATLVVAFICVAASATVHNSATFDEILFPAAGARGFMTGDFELIRDHPRLMQYVYGAPLLLLDLRYPSEAGGGWRHIDRYEYARALLWVSGNSPERIILVSRLVAVLLGAALVTATFVFTRRAAGTGAALLTSLLVAVLPDVLAHSGVTYNDLPLALAMFVAVHWIDRAVRDPAMRSVAPAGLATGIAIGVKTTALLLLPIAGALLLLEAFSGRWREARWRSAVLLAMPVFAFAAYAVLVAIYLGDFQLRDLADVIRANMRLNDDRRTAVLLGASSATGFWYFFPVAFLLKTPAALHVLALVAIASGWAASRSLSVRELCASALRPAATAVVLIVALLMTTKINIGFRHALPALPFACVLIGAGVAAAWKRSGTALRSAIAAAVVWNAGSALASYPYFIPYLSEYVRGRPIYEVLVDSNTDWGQGLVALREFMRERGIAQIYLGYLGSAFPEAYGIDYVAAPSFFPLRGGANPSVPPRYIAISSTLLDGLYVKGDPYARYRSLDPVAVLAGSLFVYEVAH